MNIPSPLTPPPASRAPHVIPSTSRHPEHLTSSRAPHVIPSTSRHPERSEGSPDKLHSLSGDPSLRSRWRGETPLQFLSRKSISVILRANNSFQFIQPPKNILHFCHFQIIIHSIIAGISLPRLIWIIVTECMSYFFIGLV